MKKADLKNDKYKKTRGGSSRLLKIYCAGCGEYLCEYQKDGVGHLKRMYLDRIRNSEKYAMLDHSPLKKLPRLECAKCKKLLGVPIIYAQENRLAYRLVIGSLKKES